MSEQPGTYHTSIDYVRDPRTGGHMHDTEGKPLFNVTFGQQAQDGTAYSRIHPQDLETIKQYIAEQVHAALHPAPGTVDVMHFLIVEARDETGKRWKGVLYAMEMSEEV